MKLSKNELIIFGRLNTLSKVYLFVVNEKMAIEHINIYAKKTWF